MKSIFEKKQILTQSQNKKRNSKQRLLELALSDVSNLQSQGLSSFMKKHRNIIFNGKELAKSGEVVLLKILFFKIDLEEKAFSRKMRKTRRNSRKNLKRKDNKTIKQEILSDINSLPGAPRSRFHMELTGFFNSIRSIMSEENAVLRIRENGDTRVGISLEQLNGSKLEIVSEANSISKGFIETGGKVRSIAKKCSYQLSEKPLKVGAFGSIFQVESGDLVLKECNIPDTNNKQFLYLVNLINEINILQELNGQNNIIPLEDVVFVEDQGGTFSLKMLLKNAKDGSLLDFCYKNKEKIDFSSKTGLKELMVVLNYYEQIVRAVLQCHKKGVIHFDLKLGNFLKDGDKIYISDFGLSKKPKSDKVSLDYRGNITSIAPEIVKASAKTSEATEVNLKTAMKTDIFSLGVILYELINKRMPYFEKKFFSESSFVLTDNFIENFKAKASLESAVHKSIHRGSDLPISEQVDNLLVHMLDTDANKRYNITDLPFIFQS